MAEAATDKSARRKCPQCGAELPDNLPAELCPRCLLKAGLGTQPIVGPGGTAAVPVAKTISRGLPQAGEKFGHYRIVRLLGEGGMGAAFEADDLETGRRVALKVLSHTLDSPEARERFFREGRLAASINHPNSVYVFGTEEIGGTPVIAMELVSGGTLQDRVRAQGPMPVGEAVDAVLQIIAGLEAAQRIGILHRDVKPSNCFRDAEGTVKIGDFGLSISTAVRTEPALTSAGEFLGTPAFCSPEQLRGDELNARSDMYSVGATLFYLLTGRTPFEAKNVVQLLATVLEQHAPSPRKFRREIPPALAKVILRCLEKHPDERFKNYRDLVRALTPYGSAAPTPATLGLRFVAGLLDHLSLSLVFMVIMLPDFGDWDDFVRLTEQTSPKVMALMLAALSFSVLYFTFLEGVWGATLGKFICRLRVVRPDNNPPGLPRALLRAVIYIGLPASPYWLVYGFGPRVFLSGSDVIQFLMSFLFYAILALLFCTVRRRNGFAALHDLATNTRVISRTALQSRPVLAAIDLPPPTLESKVTVGPYHVLDTMEKSSSGEWLLGYDLRLLRKVWLRVVPPGTQAVPATLRNIARAGRLRWLAGRRTPEENWDAYEAVSGKPLIELVRAPQPWSQVRYWLHDLATEINAAEKDDTLPVLALDRVWITADGRAKLLDFSAPGVAAGLRPAVEGGILPPGQSPDVSALTMPPPILPPGTMPGCTAGGTPAATTHFLSLVAAAALTGRADAAPKAVGDITVPLPLHARAFLKNLPQLLDSNAVLLALKPLLLRVTEVTRLRRAAIVIGCLAFPLFMSLAAVGSVKMMHKWRESSPELMELNQLLAWRKSVHMAGVLTKKEQGPTDRQFAIYIASHYRDIVTNETKWTSAAMLTLIKGESRRFVEQSVTEHPAPSEKEIAEADRLMKPYLASQGGLTRWKQPLFSLTMGCVTLGFYVALPALIAALAFRGGLVLLIAGVTFVRKDGVRASRLRVFWRSVVAWSAMAAAVGLFLGYKSWVGELYGALIAALLIGVLTVLSVALPKRGLQDRLAGTWPVPR